jgi:hypothetical protein
MRHRELGLRGEQACPRSAVKSCAQIQDSAVAVVTGVKLLKQRCELVVNGFLVVFAGTVAMLSDSVSVPVSTRFGLAAFRWAGYFPLFRRSASAVWRW